MKSEMKWSETPEEFFQYLSGNIDKAEKILFEGGTGCGKTTMITNIPKFVKTDKIIFILLTPSELIDRQIKIKLGESGITTQTFNSFRKNKPLDSQIVICATHSSFNNRKSIIHEDGDTKGILKLFSEYQNSGYRFLIVIDEAGIFVASEQNETFKILSQFPKNSLEVHFTATPDDKVLYDKVFFMPNEEIEKTGRIKKKIELNRLGHNDDFEMINDVLQKRQEISPYYFGATVTAQFFCNTGSGFSSTKKMIIDLSERYGISNDQIMDLTIEGRDENEVKFHEFLTEIKSPTHKYKVIITKFAGSVGLDVPSISVQGILRNMDKSLEKQQTQILGRGKRTFNGKKASNDIQDTLFVFVKNEFQFPEYLENQIKNTEKTTLFLNKDIDESSYRIKTLKVENVCQTKKKEDIQKELDLYDFDTIKKEDSTITEKYLAAQNFDLTANTINGLEKILEKNTFDDLDFQTSYNIKNNLKRFLNGIDNDGFRILLKKLNMDENQLTLLIKKNLIFRENLTKIIKNLNNKSKKYKLEETYKTFSFPNIIQKHKTSNSFSTPSGSIYWDKLLYRPEDETMYFDSQVEKDFFTDLCGLKNVEWVVQNLRANQGGISFYIPEKDIVHSPDFIFKINGKIYFAETTTSNKIKEKEIFIKSEGIPENYLLVVSEGKKLLSLSKSECTDSVFHNINQWKKNTEQYVNL
jgi:hypothetical protein